MCYALDDTEYLFSINVLLGHSQQPYFFKQHGNVFLRLSRNGGIKAR